MEKLKAQGWYLTEQGFDLVSDAGAITDVQKLIKRALDIDLREIGSGQGDINEGNIVLQIQKLRNVAAPKNNQESKSSPRMLKLYLTDGKNNYQAIEIDHISSINLNTPPGTKLLLKSNNNIQQSHGIYLLKPSNISSVLGGKVINLIEKWELNKKLAFHTRVRSAEEGGPPPWIPFGKKIIKVTEQDKNFKSWNDKDSINKDNTEFEAQRQDAIAEAAKQGSKKIFGGGTKQLLDHSVQKIVDQGFTIDQAEYALKINRNNVDRALKSLQKNDNNKGNNSNNNNNNPREPREQREPRGKRFEKKTDETKPSSGKVSLFDFLEDKLPAQLESLELSATQSSYSSDNYGNSRLDNNHYDRNEGRGMDNHQQGKGRRGGNRGGRGGGYQAPPRHSEDQKFPKRSNNNENFNANQYGNSHQTKPPRFQRNPQESHYHQQEQNYRGNHQGKQFQQTTDRRNDFSKNQQKNQHESNNRYHGESFDSFNKQSDFKNTRPHNRSSHESNQKLFNQTSGGGGERSGKSQGKFQGNSEVNNTSRVFAGQSQRSDNVDRQKNEPSSGGAWSWKKGDQCMAKYWEDNRYYNAEVTAVSSKTCVVQFKEFNNYEEVLQVDCIPITEDFSHTFSSDKKQEHRSGGGGGSGVNRAPRHEQNYSGGGMEFRRGGGGSGTASGSKNNFNRKRGQQRSAQAIYQPPAQRGHAN